MKIHIVQKGDTLWEIAKNYGVDFEQLKAVNSHLSSPDMIMPGMKIKIPSTSKSVKQSMPPKETMKETVTQPYKDISPKPMPVMKEDDKKEKKIVKPEMPVQPLPQMPMQPIMQMPTMEQDYYNYTTINMPQMPQYTKPKEEPKKEKVKEEIKAKPIPQPVQPMYQPMHQPMPGHMVPLCCHVMHPCFPPVPFQVMAHMADGFMPAHPMQPPVQTAGTQADCGCGGSNNSYPGYPMDPFALGNTGQNIMQQPMMTNSQQMPSNQMYPPQFNQAGFDTYPTPPEFPGFPAFQNRTEDENKSE